MAILESTTRDGIVILTLKGNLDFDGMRQVEGQFAELSHRPGQRTVVDLTSISLVTTPTISMFIAAANAAKSSAGRIIFTQATPPVHNVLTRLRLHAVLHTIDGLENAIAEARK